MHWQAQKSYNIRDTEWRKMSLQVLWLRPFHARMINVGEAIVFTGLRLFWPSIRALKTEADSSESLTAVA